VLFVLPHGFVLNLFGTSKAPSPTNKDSPLDRPARGVVYCE
jgi:hypothetical protein